MKISNSARAATTSSPALRALSPLLAALVLATALPAAARQAAETNTAIESVSAETDGKTLDDYDALAKMAVNHPNELYRIYGAKFAANGQWRDAANSFRKASRYADKYSQHRLSMMYWHGVGVGRDRVEAYVWADLAAERGYPDFLAIREKMWAELTPEQQSQVADLGNRMYAEYGDPVAKRRFADALAHGKRKVTGSRTGFVGFLSMIGRGTGTSLAGDGARVNLEKLFDASRVDPEKYWEFEDHVWKTVTVTVGDIERTSTEPSSTPKAETPAKTP
jgi:hypothetical protein